MYLTVTDSGTFADDIDAILGSKNSQWSFNAIVENQLVDIFCSCCGCHCSRCHTLQINAVEVFSWKTILNFGISIALKFQIAVYYGIYK